MKKIFALILVLLMLVPFVASCKTDEPVDTNTNTATNTNTNTNTNTDTNTDQGQTPAEKTAQEEIDAIKDSFVGQTINILASGVFSQQGGSKPGAPWGQAELCVPTKEELDNYDGSDPTKDPMAINFGVEINTQVMKRKNAVETEYGVTLNYIDVGGAQMQTRLRTAAGNTEIAGETIHVAMPRVLETQSIVIDESVYNLNGSKFIDFDASYYNKEALETYTLGDKTFFLGGDISFLDEHTSHVIFYNLKIAAENQAFPDVFDLALSGQWTIDTLYTLSSAVSEDVDGIDGQSDADKYGFGTRGLAAFYQYFGVYQVSKKSNADSEEYYLSIRDDKVSSIIQEMIKASKNPTYIRTTWAGYGTMQAAFEDNRLLFYHEVIQKLDYFGQKPELQVGVLPFPKLNAQQERYYSPSASQATLICIPRATDDREMSEAFVEILSKSASKYIMPAYYDMIESKLYAATAEKSMRVIKEQIFDNMMYDLGYMYGYGGLVTESIQQGSIEGNVNNFDSAYGSISGAGAAEDIIADWNAAYDSYVDVLE